MITIHSRTLRKIFVINSLLIPFTIVALVFNRELPASGLLKFLGSLHLFGVGLFGAALALGERTGHVTVIPDEKERNSLGHRMKGWLDEWLQKGR